MPDLPPARMSAPLDLPTVLASGLALGVAGALHCAGMCGPLAAGFLGARAAVAAYHLARLTACALLGSLFGAFGAALGSGLAGNRLLPLGLAALMLCFALLPRLQSGIAGGGALAGRMLRIAGKLGPVPRAATLGAVTPLLPCGLAYAAFAGAAATGGAAAGAAFLAAFALGGAPGLFASHAVLQWLHGRFGPRGTARFTRALLVVAALALVMRAAVPMQHHGGTHPPRHPRALRTR